MRTLINDMKTLYNVVLFVVVLCVAFGSVPVSAQSDTMLERVNRPAGADGIMADAVRMAGGMAMVQQQGGGNAVREGVGTLIAVVGGSAIAAGVWTIYEERKCASDYEAARERFEEFIGDCESVNADLRYGWTITGIGAGLIILGVAVGRSGRSRPSKVPVVAIGHRGGEARWAW